MTNRELYLQIEKYQPYNDEEVCFKEVMLSFLEHNEDALLREIKSHISRHRHGLQTKRIPRF